MTQFEINASPRRRRLRHVSHGIPCVLSTDFMKPYLGEAAVLGVSWVRVRPFRIEAEEECREQT